MQETGDTKKDSAGQPLRRYSVMKSGSQQAPPPVAGGAAKPQAEVCPRIACYLSQTLLAWQLKVSPAEAAAMITAGRQVTLWDDKGKRTIFLFYKCAFTLCIHPSVSSL